MSETTTSQSEPAVSVKPGVWRTRGGNEAEVIFQTNGIFCWFGRSVGKVAHPHTWTENGKYGCDKEHQHDLATFLRPLSNPELEAAQAEVERLRGEENEQRKVLEAFCKHLEVTAYPTDSLSDLRDIVVNNYFLRMTEACKIHDDLRDKVQSLNDENLLVVKTNIEQDEKIQQLESELATLRAEKEQTMDSKELIAAAERAESIQATIKDIKLMANYVLANVNEDDGEPLTEEWLCFIAEETAESRIWLIKSADFFVVREFRKWFLFSEAMYGNYIPKTRGQLRSLITALKGGA